jgi:hypothetical protein
MSPIKIPEKKTINKGMFKAKVTFKKEDKLSGSK